MVEHGVDPKQRHLFLIDGSKAFRTAINAVFGAETPVQRCRNHKLRNVLGRLPREPQAQTGSLMRAAWKLDQKDGPGSTRSLVGWSRIIPTLQQHYWKDWTNASRLIGWMFSDR